MSAQVSITQLPAAGAITGTESVPIVQNGVTVQTTTGAIAGSPTQTYTYLTVSQTPQLANSRYVGVTNGLVITDAGAQGLFNISTTGALLSLVNSGTGFQVKTSSTAITGRSIAVSGVGLSISNGSGVSGDPTIALAGQVLNLANASINGFVVLTSAGAITSTTLTGTANQIGITNPTGVGNPVFSIANDPVMPGNGAMTIPIGTTGQQPVASTAGMIRYDTTQGAFYGYSGSAWNQFSLSGGVTQVNTGTGLTGGPITGVGTISLDVTTVTAGSYGSSTQVGTFTVNAQGQLTAAANVSISASAIGAITTINGTANEITATGASTVTLSLPAALTFTGKTVTGGTYSSPNIATIINTGTLTLPTSTDTLVGRATTDTLTNKTISGASNTLSNIANASLTNSAITINGSSVSLGASVTVTATASNALTIGTGLTGTSYNGSAAVTIGIDSTVATLTGTQTLTNKTLTSPTINTPTIATPTLTGGTINNTVIGATTPVAGTFTSVAMTTGTITTAPTGGTDIVNKDYADSIAAGLNYHQPVSYATTTTLPTYVYNNGASGVGATITAVANGALSLGGGSPTATQRVLIKNEISANAPYNGVYVVTQAGTTLLPFILTRATDYDTSGTGTNEIDQGDYVLVISGTLASTAWVQQTPLPITVGTTALTFIQFNAPITYSAGTGLNESPAFTFNIANTGVSSGSYGLAASVPTIAINAQGQITSASNTAIAIAASQVTSGTLAIAQGGTNSSATPTAGGAGYGTGTAHAYTAAGTAGQVLTSAGASAPTWSGISGGTF